MVAKRLSIHPHSDLELRAIEPTNGMDPFVSRTIHLGDESTDAAKEKYHKSVLVCDITLHSPSDCRISNAADQMKYVDMLRWAPLVPELYKVLKAADHLISALSADDIPPGYQDVGPKIGVLLGDMIAQDDQNTLP